MRQIRRGVRKLLQLIALTDPFCKLLTLSCALLVREITGLKLLQQTACFHSICPLPNCRFVSLRDVYRHLVVSLVNSSLIFSFTQMNCVTLSGLVVYYCAWSIRCCYYQDVGIPVVT